MLSIFATPEEMAVVASEFVVGLANSRAATEGRFTIALSGGSTPRGLYQTLASPSYASRAAWDSWHVFWSDERCVPPSDAESNYGMARGTLLEHVPIPSNHVHRIRGEASPEVAADEYEDLVRQLFPASMPAFDLILLGLGEDGHTASLFPGTAALEENRRLVVANWVPQLSACRITFTLSLIDAAKTIAFLVAGSSKAPALKEVLEPNSALPPLPAARVRPPSGELHWFVTRDAAGLL